MKTTRRAFLNAAGSAAVTTAFGSAKDLPSGASALAPTSAADDLCFKQARELASLIRSGKVSAREIMTAHLRQIARVNPKVNAIVAKLEDAQCLALADAADQRQAR